MVRAPRATYRLQFNAGFTFDDARRISAYLAELGIEDIYASPILRARKGSPHGYDVVDATSLNPELGTDDDFDALHRELRRLDMGFLLDVVPNHMAASAENAWWMSVLENGAHSRYLHYFDIDWSPVTAQGKTVTKVLLPILGRPYGESVDSHEIRLGFDHDGFFSRTTNIACRSRPSRIASCCANASICCRPKALRSNCASSSEAMRTWRTASS